MENSFENHYRFRKYIYALRSRNRIFLISHMRGNTSLLGHILGSNPSIEGYYELHHSYSRILDLTGSKLKYYAKHQPKPRANYFFDKLLHNKLYLNPQLLSDKDRLIFMLREPAETVQSITKIFTNYKDNPWSRHYGAEIYYRNRLVAIRNFASGLNRRYFYLDSRELIKDTDRVLGSLSAFLDLPEDLRKEYDMFPKTGQWGAGDSSSNIAAGKVVLKNQVVALPEVEPDTLREYDKTRELLMQNSA